MSKKLMMFLIVVMALVSHPRASAETLSQDLSADECTFENVELASIVLGSAQPALVCRGLPVANTVAVVAENVLACSWRQNSAVAVRGTRAIELALQAERGRFADIRKLELVPDHSCVSAESLTLSPNTGYKIAPAGPGNSLGHFAALIGISRCLDDDPPGDIGDDKAAPTTCYVKFGRIRIGQPRKLKDDYEVVPKAIER